MDEIRTAAWEGLQQLVHGGLEIGGVMFGARRDHSIRILTWRPIACEHAEGPTLRFSSRDRLELAKLLQAAKNDPDLAGLEPVGWFLSHARSDIFLTASDLEIYGAFFPEPWQVTLVLRPGRNGSARAGFFVREPDCALRSESSFQEFAIEPLRPLPSKPPEQRKLPPELYSDRVRTESKAPVEPVRQPELATAVEPPSFLVEKPRPQNRLKWLWAIPALLALIIAGMLAKEFFLAPYNQSFSFRAFDVGATVELEWDPNSEPIRTSSTAELDIKDGTQTPHYSLSSDDLREGKMTYMRHSSDLELRMTVHPARHGSLQEFARVVGSARTQAALPPARQSSAPSAPPDATQLRAERDQLAAEVRSLKQELAKEKTRADKASEMYRILQNRVDVDAARGIGPDGKPKK